MTEKSQEQNRDDFLQDLLFLIFPIKQIVEADDCSQSKVSHVRAAFNTQKMAFLQPLRDLCTLGGITYEDEFMAIWNWMQNISGLLNEIERLPNQDARRTYKDPLDYRIAELRKLFKAVPCEIPDFILPANRPFDAYRRLRSLIQNATTRVELFDAYCSADIFHRYLADVEPSVSVVVVTNPIKLKGDVRASFLSVSELFSAQRPTTYRLVMNSTLHDRHLRLDDTIWLSGGSFKDAARNSPYSCAQLESSATKNKDLDDLISNGEEWFGQIVTKHRKS